MNLNSHNKKLKRLSILAIVILLLACVIFISASSAQGSIDNSNLRVSLLPDRTQSRPLDGSRLNSIAYVYADVSSAKRVAFYLDGTTKTNRISIERLAPYDFARTAHGGTSNPFDFSKLSVGDHVIYAKVILNSNEKVWINGKFQVGDIVPTTTIPSTTIAPTTTVPVTTTLPSSSNIQTNNKLIYASSQGLSNVELFISDLNGRNKTQLTNDAAYSNAWPRVTPNGKTVFFYRFPPTSLSSDYFNYSLWKINSDGTGLKEVLPKGANGWWLQGHVDISPDGTKLVFGALVTLKGMRLFTSDLDGQNLKELDLKSQNVIDPAFAPDGKIIFTACPEGTDANDGSNYEVYLTDVNGSYEKRLTFDKYRDHDPAVSPDGKRISFLTLFEPGFKGVGKWGQRIMNIDGSNSRVLISQDHFSANPRWVDNAHTVYGYFDWDLAGWGIRITDVDTFSSQILIQPQQNVGLSTASVLDPFPFKQ